MAETLLGLVQEAAILAGLPQPSSVSTTDTTSRQLIQHMKEVARDMRRRHEWGALSTDYTFTGDGTSTEFTLPADFDRFAKRAYQRPTPEYWPVVGGVSPQDWLILTNTVVAAVGRWFRLKGNVIEFFPAPPASESINTIYQSTKWVADSGGTAKTDWTADTDVPRIDGEVLKLGCIWRFKRQAGLQYQHEFQEFEAELARACAHDRQYRPIATGRASDEIAPLYAPDSIPVA